MALRLQATFADQNNSSTPGIIRLGEVDMPDVTPKGANVVIALAMWNSAGRRSNLARRVGALSRS